MRCLSLRASPIHRTLIGESRGYAVAHGYRIRPHPYVAEVIVLGIGRTLIDQQIRISLTPPNRVRNLETFPALLWVAMPHPTNWACFCLRQPKHHPPLPLLRPQIRVPAQGWSKLGNGNEVSGCFFQPWALTDQLAPLSPTALPQLRFKQHQLIVQCNAVLLIAAPGRDGCHATAFQVKCQSESQLTWVAHCRTGCADGVAGI
jgi:hypothetical protein